MDKKIYLSILAALATAVVIWLFALLAAPIAMPLAWALIIGIATMPHHDRLVRKFPDKPNRAAGLMVLAVTVCFILPLVGLAVTIAQHAPTWFSDAQELVRSLAEGGVATLNRIPILNRITSLADRAGIDLGGYAQKFAGTASGVILQIAAATAKGLAQLLFILAVALFILFFIYRDGERFVSTALDRFSDNKPRIRRFLSGIRSTVTAVTVGTIYTCIAQGIIAGLGYFVADIPAPILWGAFTGVAALVPVVGTAIIWAPLVIFVALQGAYLKAGLLALWCVIFVGLADNAIRPLAVGAKGDFPVLAIVLGAICGVTTMGLLGLILGPVIFAALITLWHDITAPADHPVEQTEDRPAPTE